MNLFTQSILSGLVSGAVYALLAAGLVIAFRTSRVLNLAHGETYVVSGLGASLVSHAGLPLWLAIGAGMAAAIAFSWAVERFFLRPRESWPIPGRILVTLGVAFVARGLMLLAAGIDPLSFPRMLPGRPVRFAGGAIPQQGILLIALSLAAALGIGLFLSRTLTGRQLRAAAEHPEAAQLMGVNVHRVRAIAFLIAGALGGLAAILLVPLISVDFQAGLGMTLRGFIAAALGGMSPLGSIAAGFGLGLFEAFITSYLGAMASDPVVFAVLIGLALWRSRHVAFGGSARA